jgi:signal transduction histidine kinase
MRPSDASMRQLAARGATGAVLAVCVVGVYVVVVVGGGALLGRAASTPDLLLSVLATALVALGLEPLRSRTFPRIASLLGGDRPTPYEALSRFSTQAGDVYAVDEVAPRMAHVLADGTGAAVAEVWVVVDGRLQAAASWPPTAVRSRSVTAAGPAGPCADPPADAVVPVTHVGDLLGALVVRKPAGALLSPVERDLITDLAAQAGLVLRSVALTTELQERVADVSARAAELAASRARVVAAHNAERRRLERDIHDGAQQHLVALVVNLRLAQTLISRAPDRALRLLDRLAAAVRDAERTLHDLASGVYPGALRERGLVAALREAATAAPLRVEVRGEDVPRFEEDVEAAIYFCCLEALQNTAKHASATSLSVEVSGTPTQLGFTVTDDGVGFTATGDRSGAGLANMADRLEALGGAVTVRSQPGRGTTVVGHVPARPRGAGAVQHSVAGGAQ